jgi:hypothetical protein
MSKDKFKESKPNTAESETDPNALVQAALREAYLSSSQDLRYYAEKVKYFNEQKIAIRQYIAELSRLKTAVLSEARAQGIDLCGEGEEKFQALARLFEKHTHSHKTSDVGYELCIPDRVPPKGVDSLKSLEDELSEWEERLKTVGDDAQLANVDLQSMLQKQQQALQMMSNISKTMHDTMMSIINNMS